MPQINHTLLSEDISLCILNFYSCRLAKVLKHLMFRMVIFRGPMKNAKCVLPYDILGYFIESSIDIDIKSANRIIYVLSQSSGFGNCHHPCIYNACST